MAGGAGLGGGEVVVVAIHAGAELAGGVGNTVVFGAAGQALGGVGAGGAGVLAGLAKFAC